MSLGRYEYMYGAGSKPNRRIEFFHDTKNPSIRAVVQACNSGQWQTISELGGEDINVEMNSVSEKIKYLLDKKSGFTSTLKPDQTLEKCPPSLQEKILSSLEPDGPWRIEVMNGFGDDPKFEKVIALTLFNPS